MAFSQSINERRWAEALELYRGDLLEGLFPGGVGQEFETWLEDQRTRLRVQASQAAWEASSCADLAGRRAEALGLARRAVELDPDDEEGVRRLIAALDRYGDRAGALRLYAEWQSQLQAEYGVEPAPETRKLVRKVQAHRKGESAETPAGRSPVAVSPAALAPAGPGPAGRRRLRPAAAVAFLVLGLVAGVGLGRLRMGTGPKGTQAGMGSLIAVLPFQGLGDSADTDVGEGVAEELTTALAHTQGIVVRSTARSREAVRGGGDVGEIGRRLGVDHLVDGSVRHDAHRLRVTVRLLRAVDAATVWVQVFDVGDGDLIEKEERIAAVVADSVRLRLTQGAPHP